MDDHQVDKDTSTQTEERRGRGRTKGQNHKPPPGTLASFSCLSPKTLSFAASVDAFLSNLHKLLGDLYLPIATYINQTIF